MGPENLKPPLFLGQPRYDAGFDGGEIGINQDVSGGGHKRSTDKLRQRIIRRAVDRPQRVELPTLDQLTGEFQRLCVGSRQVLNLYQTSGPSARPVCTVELKHPTDVGVVTAQQLFDRLLAEGGNVVAGFGGQPAGKLLNTVGVLQPGKLDGLVGELRANGLAQLKRAFAEVHVNSHAARIDK